MAAANTDLFSKLSRKWVGQIGSGGVANGTDTTIPLSSATNLATDTGVIVVIDRVDANGTKTPTLEETVIGVVSGSNLVSCTRGIEGTAQAHSAGAVVEVLVTAKNWNNLVDGILVQHNQLGGHTDITASNITASATTSSLHYKVIASGDFLDANSNELFKFTQTASAVNEFTVANAATGNNPVLSATGSDSNIGISVKMKGTSYFKKPTVVHVPVFAPTATCTTGDGKQIFEVPEELNGMNITAVGAYITGTNGTTGTMDIQIRNATDTQDILSTKITIDSTEASSRTAATPAVINTSYDDLATGDRIAFDFDAVHTTAALGCTVWFRAELP